MDDKVAKVFVIVDLKLRNTLKHSKIICYFCFLNDSVTLLNHLNKIRFKPLFWLETNSFLKFQSLFPDQNKMLDDYVGW